MSVQPAGPGAVRRCEKCQLPAVVCVMTWENRGSFSSTGTEEEWRCQECGETFVKKPRMEVIAYWVVGVILALGCVGLPFLWVAWRQQRFEQRLPVVPGVAQPRMKFPGGAPPRRCAHCDGEAKAVTITRHTHRGLPTGTTFEYECSGCKKGFTTESAWGHVTSLFGGALLGFISAAFLTARNESPGWRWGGGLGLGAFSAFVVGSSAVRLANRKKHPVIVRAVL